ncbi:class I SAM-dependent methyltransferase [Monashia sp. NPDC004114]
MAGLQASRTAVWVCQGRAVAHGRLAPGRFSDPVAQRLLRPDEQADVDMALGPVPEGPERRVYDLLWSTAAVFATRTVAIDDALGSRPGTQVVVVGAGLDGRAWRLPQLADTTVFEVDQPASQADKKARTDGLASAAKGVVFVPVELGKDTLLDSLVRAGFDPRTPTTWILEGVLDYLTEAQVHATLSGLCGASAPGSRLVATYTVCSDATGSHPLDMLSLEALFTAAGRPNLFEHEPMISAWTPEQMHALLATQQMSVVSDIEHLSFAGELGLDTRFSDMQKLARVVVAAIGYGL